MDKLTLNKTRDIKDDPARADRVQPQPARIDVAALRAQARQADRDSDTEFLAKLPEIPGYHVLWVNGASQSMGPRYYERRHYTFVTKEEAPDWQGHSTSTTVSEHANYITCNEMVAMKVPEEIYQEYMLINHHERPLQLTGEHVDAAKNLRDASEGAVRLEEGFGEQRKMPRPRF